MANRLKVGDISLRELILLSISEYRKKTIDDKKERAKLDIRSGRVVFKKNLTYNQSIKGWEVTGREVRIDFIVKSVPISYDAKDNVNIHSYPITMVFRNWEKGFDSAIKIRVGAQKKPKFPTRHVSDAGSVTQAKTEKEKEKIRKAKKAISDANQKITDWNIRAGLQMGWFYNMSRVYAMYGILWGRDFTNGLPKHTNPHLIPYLSKHEYFICIKILPYLFKSPKLNTFIKNNSNF